MSELVGVTGKKLDEEKAELEFKKAQDELRKRAETMFCPKCNTSMLENGVISLTYFKKDKEDLKGDYCLQCYGSWIASNIPKYEVRDVPKA